MSEGTTPRMLDAVNATLSIRDGEHIEGVYQLIVGYGASNSDSDVNLKLADGDSFADVRLSRSCAAALRDELNDALAATSRDTRIGGDE